MKGYAIINFSGAKNNTFANVSLVRNKKDYFTRFTGSIVLFIKKKKEKNKRKVAREIIKKLSRYASLRLKDLENDKVVLRLKNVKRRIQRPAIRTYYRQRLYPKLILENSTTPHNGCKRKKRRRIRKNGRKK